LIEIIKEMKSTMEKHYLTKRVKELTQEKKDFD